MEFMSSAIDSYADTSPEAFSLSSNNDLWKATAPMYNAPPRGSRFANPQGSAIVYL